MSTLLLTFHSMQCCASPQWMHSAFTFEYRIGYLTKRCHAAHDITKQVLFESQSIIHV